MNYYKENIEPFKQFLLSSRKNKTTLAITAIAIVLQFLVFKYYYPFANYIHGDSFSYLNAAHENSSINTYLIGYSKFLRLFSVFSKSDYTLAAFQYLIIQLSVLFLLFTLFYFHSVSNITRTILLGIMVFNPLFLHLANLVSSDGIFLALSITYFTLLLWIIHKPSSKIILFHALLLLLTFTLRYNAIIYPCLSILSFYLSKLTLRNKILGIVLSIFVCSLFIAFTMNEYKKLTGYWQYSPFSGWQLANNAMYTYRFVDSIDRKPVPKRFLALDNMIREYFDSTRNLDKNPQETLLASTVYMWTPSSSLYQYRNRIFIKDSTMGEFKKWASMGPLYSAYGIYIIKTYPKQFAQYFIWPNSNKYFAPPIEFMATYNSGKDSVLQIAKEWFGYKNRFITTRMADKRVNVLNFYPIISGMINLVILISIICFVILRGGQYDNKLKKSVIIGSTVWLLNAIFTIGASSPALRFQSFPILLTTIYSFLLIDWMVGLMTTLSKNSIISKTPIDAIDNKANEALNYD